MLHVNFEAYNRYVTDSLYQWDINRQLNITGLQLSDVPEIHFSNANMERAIVRPATYIRDIVSVTIPNSLLQFSLPIKVYIGIYEGDSFKIIETITIPVIPKERPMDYVFVDDGDEIYSYNELLTKISKFDGISVNDLKSYVEWVERVNNTYTKQESISISGTMSSYLAFVGNVNIDMVNAGLGKNNEDNITGVGRALALYARYKEPTLSIDSLPNLVLCETLTDMSNDLEVKQEILNNEYLRKFLFNNEYALNKFNPTILAQLICDEPVKTDFTRTASFSVTNEMLNGETLFFLESTTTPYATMGTNYNVFINDIVVDGAMVEGEKKIIPITLSDYGITKSGTYKLKTTIGTEQIKQFSTLYSI